MADRLERLGLAVHRGLGGTGVVGTLPGSGDAAAGAILLRADMDALPIEERSGVAYARPFRRSYDRTGWRSIRASMRRAVSLGWVTTAEAKSSAQ